jgi:hypothetical protein
MPRVFAGIGTALPAYQEGRLWQAIYSSFVYQTGFLRPLPVPWFHPSAEQGLSLLSFPTK